MVGHVRLRHIGLGFVHVAGGGWKRRRVFASGPFFNGLKDVGQFWQVVLNATDDLFVDVVEVEDGHPLLPQIQTESLRVERKLQEYMHFGGFLGHNQFAEIHDLEFVEAEETQVRKDLVQSDVVAIRRWRTLIKEHSRENLPKEKQLICQLHFHRFKYLTHL